MTKLQFLWALHQKLAQLPPDEAEERLRFYSEMIEDRMEDGLSEADAVAAVGSVEEIAAQILSEQPQWKQKTPSAGRKGWQTVLLVLGFPLWFPLLLAAGSVVLSLYLSLWSVIVALWAVFGGLVGCALGGLVGALGLGLAGKGIPAMALAGCGLACAGVAIVVFYGCKAVTGGAAWLTAKGFRSIFCRKERSA